MLPDIQRSLLKSRRMQLEQPMEYSESTIDPLLAKKRNEFHDCRAQLILTVFIGQLVTAHCESCWVGYFSVCGF